MPGGFNEDFEDQAIKEDEQCINCKKNPLAGTLPTSVIVKIVAIIVLLAIAFFSLGLFSSHILYGIPLGKII